MEIMDKLIFILIGAVAGIWIGGAVSYLVARKIVQNNFKLREELRISKMVARHQASVIGQYGEEFERLVNESRESNISVSY